MRQALLSKYRNELMGFAVIWIAFVHAQMWFRFPLLQAFKLTGQGGVDIFLFLSSFGLYYAYQKKESYFTYLKKRLLRILPIAIPIACVRIIADHLDMASGSLLVSTLIFWVGWDRSMWFVSAIIVLYIFTPFYLSFLEKGHEKEKTIISIVIAFLISFLLKDSYHSVFLSRIPVFLLGFYAGKLSFEDKIFSKKEVMYFVLSLFVGILLLFIAFQIDTDEKVLWGWGMYWYPNFLIACPLCLFLSNGFETLQNKGKSILLKVLRFVGSISLEFYLLHELCIRFFGNRISFPYPYEYNGILENVIIIFITMLIAWIYHLIMGKVIGLLLGEKRV